jgi:hypothetical protein
MLSPTRMADRAEVREAVGAAPAGHIPFRAVVCGPCRDGEDTMDAATMIRLEMAPLTKPIGAEIRGIDLRDDLTPSNFSQCWSSFMGR